MAGNVAIINEKNMKIVTLKQIKIMLNYLELMLKKYKVN